MSASAFTTVEQAARDAYGRLLSSLVRRSRDIAAAEDALGDAFAAALTQWPRDGVPQNPEAWLLTASRRRMADSARRRAVRTQFEPHVTAWMDELTTAPTERGDERLQLMFVCTHPAIERAVQPALMLQTVLGLDAGTIASSMLVAPKTLGQRLWRAKQKVRDVGLAFEVPEPAQMTERLGAVLEAVYAAFGTGWEDVTQQGRCGGLVQEALFLCRLLVTLMPDEPEPRGLLSLMRFAEARREARRSASGDFVPLDAQDVSLWDAAAIAEAERLLKDAFTLHRPGPWQLEAAIQSVHVFGRYSGTRDVRALVDLYDGLVHFAPTLGARVSRAAALLEAAGPQAALQALDLLQPADVRSYQPYWVVRAHVLETSGRRSEALAARQTAIGLTEDPAVRRYLTRRNDALQDARGTP